MQTVCKAKELDKTTVNTNNKIKDNSETLFIKHNGRNPNNANPATINVPNVLLYMLPLSAKLENSSITNVEIP